MSADRVVLVGAAGWECPDWRGPLYPDELPDDWMLSYYNTQFQAVYLPAATWEAASETTWRQWLDDTREDFYFVLEPGSGASRPPASPRVVVADPAWAATHVWWLDDAPDLRALAARIADHAARGEPLFVFSRRADLARLEQVKALEQIMGY